MASSIVAEHAKNRDVAAGRTGLEDLVRTLEKQRENRFDIVADSTDMRVEKDPAYNPKERNGRGGLLILPETVQMREFIPQAGVPISWRAIGQLAGRIHPSISAKWFRELLDLVPDIAVDLVNALWHDDKTRRRRFFRFLGDQCRAILGANYRPLDHYDLLFTALDVAKDRDARVLECSLSETNMHVKLIDMSVWEALNVRRTDGTDGWYAGGLGNKTFLNKVGASSIGDLPGGIDSCHPIVTISNSETGHGGTYNRLGILEAACYNIATVETLLCEYHTGRELALGLFSESTLQLEDQLSVAKIQDTIKSAFDEDRFRAIVARVRDSESEKVLAPTLAVNNLCKNTDLTEEDRDRILEKFLGDYKPTRMGVAQAVGRRAQDVSGDKAVELEQLAGKLMTTGRKLLLSPEDEAEVLAPVLA